MAIARINSREQLKQYALRALGAPVLRINVDDTQLEDRIDDALALWWEFHMDGSQRVFLRHTVTAQDISSKKIELSKDVISVLRVLNAGDELTSGISTANLQYTYYMTDVMDLQNIIRGIGDSGMGSYAITSSYLNTMENLFSPEKVIGFNMHKNTLRFDADLTNLKIGDLLIAECYIATDPDEHAEVWNDRWIKEYTTALFKRQWGQNLVKFGNAQLSGGIVINGEKILADAVEEIKLLDEKLKNEYQPPVDFFVG